jgi:peptide/nickel transport system permease protein
VSHLLPRLGLYAVAAWFAITLNFALPRMMPGDPVQALFARFQGRLEPAALDALQVTLGLSQAPLPEQYLQYLAQLLRGDLGVSLVYFPTPVSEVIAGGLGWTVFLAGGALVVAFLLGSAIGAVAAWRRGGALDTFAPPLLSFLAAFPYFWLSMAAVWLFGFQLGWFPVRHAWGPEVTPGFDLAFAASAVRHALLPGATLVVASLAGWVLTMRNAMMGVLDDDPIRFAQARGLSPDRIFVHYAIRNAMLPSLTSFGMALGFVLSGALLTEIVFAYPGQGYLLLQAVRGQDYPLLQGLFLTITLAVLGANALVDLAVTLLDPRTRR